MSESYQPHERMTGVELKDTTTATTFMIDAESDGTLVLTAIEPPEITHESTPTVEMDEQRETTVSGLKLDINHGEYYFPDPDHQSRFVEAAEAMDDDR